MSKNIAIILAGGSGTRMGLEMPKQFLEIAGKNSFRAYCLSFSFTCEDR